jgi:DUF4097 and DUF4098 domain-containing protein YvlB
MKTRAFIAAILILTAGSASAAVWKTFRSDQKFQLAPNGTLVLDNPVGNITITGKDTPDIDASLLKAIGGTSAEAIEEGRQQTTLIIGGDANGRTLRTTMMRNPRSEWSASVEWRIAMPRTANLRVLSGASGRVHISGMRGTVQIKNFNGHIILEDVTGATTADSVNGSISFRAPQIRKNVMLTSVNGSVTAHVPADAGFRWVAETVKGDIRTNLRPRGAFFGNVFRGTINAPGGPTISTGSLMGTVQVLGEGKEMRAADSLRRAPRTPPPMMRTAGPSQEAYQGFFRYRTNVGDVRVQQIVGDADIYTGAGEVQLGAVSGTCKVQSRGGPLQLGEILGLLTASTGAGDILVDSARRGGVITTNGGTIRLLYTSGPTRLESRGGDITVRQAAAPVTAETTSGDIFIAVDTSSKTQKFDAKTAKGNVILNVNPQFGAEVEATIFTSDPDTDTIASDIPGLSISRDQVNGKTRVRATGKINGGGEKITLQATDGDIRISTGPVPPTVVTRR